MAEFQEENHKIITNFMLILRRMSCRAFMNRFNRTVSVQTVALEIFKGSRVRIKNIASAEVSHYSFSLSLFFLFELKNILPKKVSRHFMGSEPTRGTDV